VIGAEGVDIQTTTSGIARIDREFLWFALTLDVGENSFNTMLMKLAQLPKADKVAQ
jgi:hypothetical protein